MDNRKKDKVHYVFGFFSFQALTVEAHFRGLFLTLSKRSNLRSDVLFSEERESIATRESGGWEGEKKERVLLYFRVPPKKERMIASYKRSSSLVLNNSLLSLFFCLCLMSLLLLLLVFCFWFGFI